MFGIFSVEIWICDHMSVVDHSIQNVYSKYAQTPVRSHQVRLDFGPCGHESGIVLVPGIPLPERSKLSSVSLWAGSQCLPSIDIAEVPKVSGATSAPSDDRRTPECEDTINAIPLLGAALAKLTCSAGFLNVLYVEPSDVYLSKGVRLTEITRIRE